MRSVGTIWPLRSGGVLVDVGDAFPVWRQDMGAARSLLLERDLMIAELNQSNASPSRSIDAGRA